MGWNFSNTFLLLLVELLLMFLLLVELLLMWLSAEHAPSRHSVLCITASLSQISFMVKWRRMGTTLNKNRNNLTLPCTRPCKKSDADPSLHSSPRPSDALIVIEAFVFMSLSTPHYLQVSLSRLHHLQVSLFNQSLAVSEVPQTWKVNHAC